MVHEMGLERCKTVRSLSTVLFSIRKVGVLVREDRTVLKSIVNQLLMSSSIAEFATLVLNNC